MLAMTQETICNILGMISITPWTHGTLFYFLGPCLLATSRNTGWMDIHEIFKIWTQEAISYTVSRLSRLFCTLQTRHGGGLRSRSASCYWCVICMTNSHSEILYLSGTWHHIPKTTFLVPASINVLNDPSDMMSVAPLPADLTNSFLDSELAQLRLFSLSGFAGT